MPDGFDRDGFWRDWFDEWAPDEPIYGWATELLVHLIEDEPEIAWELILGLVARAPDEDALGWVGAGPLEDLLCKQGSLVIDRVEDLAVSDARFQKCLSHVRGSNRMEPEIYSRMCLAAPGKRPAAERA